MPFPYYARLSAREKRIYRESAAIREVPLGGDVPRRFELRLAALRAALAADSPRLSTQAATLLVVGLCDTLNAPRTKVLVRARRPRRASSELHGLYTRWDDGTSQIEVWMRTHANENVVAFRTFLRTLLHEVCHHLDYVHFQLADSLHTEGFFRRESSLVRQLLGEKKAEKRAQKPQLSLF